MRSKELYYQTIPYLKRDSDEPGWQFEFLNNAKDYEGRIVFGANRIGKTYWGAYECALMVTGDHPTLKYPDEGRMWIIALDNKFLDTVNRPLFEKLIPNRYMANGKWHGKNNYWELKHGNRNWEVHFKSADAGRAKFQADNINHAWLDEEPRAAEDIFPELETRLIDRNGKWHMTATPIFGTKWLKKVSERDNVYSITAGMYDNPYLPLSKIDEIAKNFTEDEKRVRIYGEYILFGGRPVFNRDLLAAMLKRANIEKCKVFLEEIQDQAA